LPAGVRSRFQNVLPRTPVASKIPFAQNGPTAGETATVRT
jgi:hypothetical protein